MTLGERLIVGGLNFTMIRILMFFGWARLIFRGELNTLRINRIDKFVLLWALSKFTFHNLLWQDGKEFQNTLGGLYNDLGMYFLFRFLVRDMQDIKQAIKMFAMFIVPVGLFMLNEKLTGRNAFAVFGGVPAITNMRDGSLRCQGPFQHPILAGTFGGTALPLFVAFCRERRNYLLACLAIASSVVIVVTCASSGPVLACICGLVGAATWRVRRQLRAIRWGVILLILSLQLVMKAPVWFLMARMDIVAGSTGYHRAALIDEAIHHFDEWWLDGTKETASWGQHLEDVTNQFIGQGIYGGVVTMALYIAIVSACFGGVGVATRAFKRRSATDSFYVWSLGAALFAHTITFLSVTYFDQNAVNFSLLLAMISAAVSCGALLDHRSHVTARCVYKHLASGAVSDVGAY
jgi:hypothetical protein